MGNSRKTFVYRFFDAGEVGSSETGVDFALDSQASFSWVMTKVEYDNGVFLVGVQPNTVPAENKAESISNKEIESLKEEINKLKAEIEQLKS